MTIRLTALAAALALTAGSVFAQDDQFAQLDADQSGGLSLSEVQAVIPDATEDQFAQYDADQSGELSSSEFSAWAGTGAEQPEPM